MRTQAPTTSPRPLCADCGRQPASPYTDLCDTCEYLYRLAHEAEIARAYARLQAALKEDRHAPR